MKTQINKAEVGRKRYSFDVICHYYRVVTADYFYIPVVACFKKSIISFAVVVEIYGEDYNLEKIV